MYLVTTLVGVAAVTVTIGAVAFPESTVIGGGVIVEVVLSVVTEMAVEVAARMVEVTL